MNFDLSEEQRLLRDLIEKFAADRYDAVRRLAYVREADGFSRANWTTLAEMGVLAFPFDEADGGFGGGPIELITIMEAIGRAVATEPLLSAIVLGAGPLARGGSTEQRDRWLPLVVSGHAIVALAHGEREARFGQRPVSTRATQAGGVVQLTGAKQMILSGSAADAFVVSAIEADGTVGLYLVDGAAAGLERRGYRLIDGSVACDLVLRSVVAEPLSGGGAMLDAVLDDARLAICAEMLGLMTMMFDATLDYIKTRSQFGQPIGAFQAIQHRMAGDYSRLELSRSQLYRAAGRDPGDVGRPAAIAAAKAYISGCATILGEDAIQLHGGIGTTEELLVGQAFKRVMLLASLLGDGDWETRRYLELGAA